MKIERLSIDSFGHFHGAEIGPFRGGIVVIHGANEAGKTTLLAFVQAVLFGFPRKTDPLWIPALNGGTPGGRVVLVDDTRERFTVGRTEGVRGGPVTVFDEAGIDRGADRLHALLGGVSRDTFQNVFSFGIDQLSTIRSLQGADISSQMYGAGMGAEGLPDALAGIEKRAGEMFLPKGSTQPVFHLLVELDEIDRALRDLPDDTARYGQLQDDLARLTAESRNLRESRRRLQEERTRVDAVLDAEHALERARDRLVYEQSNAPAVNDSWLAERAASIQAAEQVNAELGILLRQFQEEDRRLAAAVASGSAAAPVVLLAGAAVAIAAGVAADGTGLVIGIVVALALGTLAAVSFMSRQRQLAGRRAQAGRVEHARVAYLKQRERLTNQLATLGIDDLGDVTAALSAARAELANADSARRTHRQHLEWLRQQVNDRELELVEARAGLDGQIADLAGHVEAIEADLETLDEQLAVLNQNIGTIRGEILRLGEGSSAAAGLHARQQQLLEALRESADTWSGQMLAREILLRSRKRFEDEHQPAVVQIARHYLNTITAGTYDRITVSSGRKEIRVFQSNGTSKLDRELSRGAREQLYLALRFGYITEFGRKSARLPVIVDDVLVNFDPARARATAEAFAELAETNQIIIFTCHPTTVDYFRAASPDVQVVELGREMAVGVG